MKQRTITQIEIVQEKDPQLFQEKLNTLLREISGTPEVTFPKSEEYCAMVKYEIQEEIPEDESERFYQEHGKYYCCNDCPFLALDPDRRAVSHWCSYHEDRVRLRERCCDDFYIGLTDGSFHLVRPEERKKQFAQMDQDELQRRKQFKHEMQEASRHKRDALNAEKELLTILRDRAAIEKK
jgi:hypothetical protein